MLIGLVNIHGLVNIDKVFLIKKNHFCYWHGDTIHAYKSIVVPQKK